MEVDNNIVHINSDEESDTSSDKPIINLFKQLICSENKQMTLLTNAKIIEILQKEFSYDIRNLHELEEEIYLTIIKKCLKDWRGWDDFAKNVNDYKDKSDTFMNKMLQKNHESLKSYLAAALNTATPLAREAVEDIKKKVRKPEDPKSDRDVVLEIGATRAQLNHLFFRYPNPTLNKTIFNSAPVLPSQIKVSSPSLQSILNWWGVNLYVLSPTSHSNIYIYKRETKHEFNHILVNKRLIRQPTPSKILNQQLQFKGSKGAPCKGTDFLDVIKEIGKNYSSTVNNIGEVLDFVVKEISMLPTFVFPIKNYRRYTNKYPYIRYLYEDIENISPDVFKTYDLQLEETIMPAYEFYLGSPEMINENVDRTTLKCPILIECKSCLVSFTGKDLVGEIKTHFATYHMSEVDFKCTNCEKEFAIEALAQNWWCHKC